MSAYSLTANANIVKKNSDGSFIPNHSGNSDWIAYQIWLTAGNSADPYFAPSPTPQQQFNMILGSGMSTSWTISNGPEGSLNGVYAIDQQTQFNITAETATILASDMFSTGGTTRYWLNMAGNPMLMNITQFEAFALAVGSYVNSLYAVLAQLQAGAVVSWPNNQVTIAA